MANPFPPPFYSISRPANRRLTHRVSTAPSGNTPPQAGPTVLIAIGKTRTGITLRLLPKALGT